jgi:hypothetical protein
VRCGNSASGLSTGVSPIMVWMLGISELAAWAGTGNEVTPSSRLLFRQSTRRPECDRKLTPMREYVTSASANRHVKSQRSSRLILRGSHPQVLMVVPLAAQMSYLSRSFRRGISLRLYTQT